MGEMELTTGPHARATQCGRIGRPGARHNVAVIGGGGGLAECVCWADEVELAQAGLIPSPFSLFSIFNN